MTLRVDLVLLLLGLILRTSYAQPSDSGIKLAELPPHYVCVVFTLDFDSSDFSRSATRQEYHAVDGACWRLELLTEPKKGFVATYDGKEVRSSSPKMRGAKLPDLQHIAPTSWFPMLFDTLRRSSIISTVPASLESLTCDRYTLKSGDSNIEVWIHTETRRPIQVIARVSDTLVAIQRFYWAVQPMKLSEEDFTDLSQRFYQRFSESLNRKVTEGLAPK